MKQDDTRLKLIDGTIHVIARDGLDKATTKSIGEETSINQAYIYRHFEDKEDMFAKTFESLDEELVNKAMQHIPVMYMQEMDYEIRCWVFFTSVWKFMLATRISVIRLFGITTLRILNSIQQKVITVDTSLL